MGLITGLLTLPLAPVRGTVWLAEKLEEQGLRELNDDSGIQVALLELDEAREAGTMPEAEIEEAEDRLVERLMVMRGFTEGEGDGTIE